MFRLAGVCLARTLAVTGGRGSHGNLSRAVKYVAVLIMRILPMKGYLVEPGKAERS